MKLIYIDEAGATGVHANPQQPIHLLAAVMLDEAQVRPVEDELRALGYKYFGAKSGNTDFEFRGYDIYHGHGYFAGMKPDERIKLVNEILDIVDRHELSLGYVAIDKLRSKAKLHPHQLAFLFLVERIEDRLTAQNALGLIVADENDDIEQRLIDDLEIFKIESTRFGWRPTKIEHVVNSIHFVRSKNNRLIQLADVIAAITYRGIATEAAVTGKFLAETDPSRRPPKMYFPEWLENFGSTKQRANIQLWHRVKMRGPFAKRFPE